jgi:hypothetical protein
MINNLKKNICLSFTLLLLFSCQKNKKELKLELLTNEIVCVEGIKKDDFLEVFYKPNKDYDSLSRNILNYRITNVSDKKYYIMLNENSIGTQEPDYYNEAIGRTKTKVLNILSFSLYKNNSILDGNSTRAEGSCVPRYESNPSYVESLFADFIIKNRIDPSYEIKSIDVRDDSLQGFFLQPGETKYFTSTINLPYRDNAKWVTNIDSIKPNQGSISLRNDSIYTKSIISENRKKEIKENKYVLFDGIIYSNRVPVKLINIKK